jgi:hypothetical protein
LSFQLDFQEYCFDELSARFHDVSSRPAHAFRKGRAIH